MAMFKTPYLKKSRESVMFGSGRGCGRIEKMFGDGHKSKPAGVALLHHFEPARGTQKRGLSEYVVVQLGGMPQGPESLR